MLLYDVIPDYMKKVESPFEVNINSRNREVSVRRGSTVSNVRKGIKTVKNHLFCYFKGGFPGFSCFGHFGCLVSLFQVLVCAFFRRRN